MSEVRMVADKRHEAFNCGGVAYQIIQPGTKFWCDEGRAVRLVEGGFAHYDISANVGEADEQPEPIPVVEPVGKVDGRTKAGRANKGR